MPASRIVHVLADLREELKALVPANLEAGEPVRMVVELDPVTYLAAIMELQHYFGSELKTPAKFGGDGVRYAGMDIVRAPE